MHTIILYIFLFIKIQYKNQNAFSIKNPFPKKIKAFFIKHQKKRYKQIPLRNVKIFRRR